jgi:hypothetical protein
LFLGNCSSDSAKGDRDGISFAKKSHSFRFTNIDSGRRIPPACMYIHFSFPSWFYLVGLLVDFVLALAVAQELARQGSIVTVILHLRIIFIMDFWTGSPLLLFFFFSSTCVK